MDTEKQAEIFLTALDKIPGMNPKKATQEQSIDFLESVISGCRDRIDGIRVDIDKAEAVESDEDAEIDPDDVSDDLNDEDM